MLRMMSIMAHQDDFESNAAGLLALMKKNHGNEVKIKILTTTRGASGHHIMGLDETFARRDAEARRSAALIDAEYECLKCLDGKHVEAQFFPDRNTLGGLWNAIRKFRPDYIFCPPLISDPLAGIHIDHYNTALAVRMLGYQLTVPHAYPLMDEKLNEKRYDAPVIINVDDMYAREDNWHFGVDISPVYEAKKIPMLLCHESQMFEWLPWNNGVEPPSVEQYKTNYRNRQLTVNKLHDFSDEVMREFFTVTKWGRSILPEDFKTLFPEMTVSEAGNKLLN